VAQPVESPSDGKSSEAVENPTKPAEAFSLRWNDGPVFRAFDNALKLTLGGYLLYDVGWMEHNLAIQNHVLPNAKTKIGEPAYDNEVRALRLNVAGTYLEKVDFKLELDFTGGGQFGRTSTGQPAVLSSDATTLKDASVNFRDLFSFASLKAGYFKEPFSLENLIGQRYRPFMERALPVGTDRNMGLQASGAPFDQRMTWAVGPFVNTDNHGSIDEEKGYSVTGRVTGLPIYADEGRTLIHVALDASYRDTPDGFRLRARPEFHLAPFFADTGTIHGKNLELFDEEAASVLGPLSFQTEILQGTTHGGSGEGRQFDGGYIMASYFLTGENRPYKRSSGVFELLRPKRNAGELKDGVRGLGAWELLARGSYLDLNSKGINGGKLADLTIGVNWYLNAHLRIMANYILSDVADNAVSRGGLENIFGLRFQVNF
jgi:phosphate-selective porin OprO/OprP